MGDLPLITKFLLASGQKRQLGLLGLNICTPPNTSSWAWLQGQTPEALSDPNPQSQQEPLPLRDPPCVGEFCPLPTTQITGPSPQNLHHGPEPGSLGQALHGARSSWAAVARQAGASIPHDSDCTAPLWTPLLCPEAVPSVSPAAWLSPRCSHHPGCHPPHPRAAAHPPHDPPHLFLVTTMPGTQEPSSASP